MTSNLLLIYFRKSPWVGGDDLLSYIWLKLFLAEINHSKQYVTYHKLFLLPSAEIMWKLHKNDEWKCFQCKYLLEVLHAIKAHSTWSGNVRGVKDAKMRVEIWVEVLFILMYFRLYLIADFCWFQHKL